jgi:hypothetical protein
MNVSSLLREGCFARLLSHEDPLDCPNFYIITDAGNGFSNLGRYINKGKPAYLFFKPFTFRPC